MTDSAIRVMVVDDQALMRTGFRMILESADGIDVVAEAGDGIAAIAEAERSRPDVILMDIRMPELDGVEATGRLMERGIEARVLILTTFDLDEYVYAAIRAGAAGFLLKDTPPEQLIEAVRIVAAGESLLAPSITRKLVEEFARSTPPTVRAPGIDDLTDREAEVLLAMARGLSNSEIAARLYVGETTVKTHVGRILMKLGVRDRVQAVVAAYESGVVRPGDA